MIEFKDAAISLTGDGRRNLAVSLRLSTGDCAVLVGPNGSGKTTVLDVVAGVRQLDRGALLVEPNGKPIAYVVQDSNSGLLPWRNVLSNILLPLHLQQNSLGSAPEQARTHLERFGLAERARDFPYKLSGGEKQLVNLMRALSTPADIVLLDEPFSPLNAVARSRARTLVRDFARGRTTILVTHDPADLDLPITRYFRIAGEKIEEVQRDEARESLSHVESEASA